MESMINNNRMVAIAQADSYRLSVINRALDEVFSAIGMDPENPFKELVKPGMRVFIKPNWVGK